MRVLILQLSDVHIRRADDPILSRAGRMVDAVRGIEHEPAVCVVALTGDVTFSGTAGEYQLAEPWLERVVSGLRDALAPCPVVMVAIPGNHDCYLPAGPGGLRGAALAGMVKDPTIASDPLTVQVCTVVQEDFFAFRDRVASDGLDKDGSRLYYEYAFSLPASSATSSALGNTDGRSALDDSIVVRVRCLNTAWTSQNPETAGVHPYPADVIRDPDPADALVITLMHHPTNWLQPQSALGVRRRLQRAPGIVLTGHEHSFGVRNQEDDTGGALLMVEGSALQAHSGGESAFNVVVIDVDTRTFRVIPFEWTRGAYVAQPGRFADWTKLAAPAKKAAEFALKKEWLENLADPGTELPHPTRGQLTLDDVFVYPDLREVSAAGAHRNTRPTRGEQVLELSGARQRILITGEREAGKTTFAKRLFTDALAAGLVPLLLDGRSAKLRGSHRDERELARAFEDQYESQSDMYLGVPRDQRVVIVDDFHAVPLDVARNVLRALGHAAGRVILLANDVTEVLQLVSLADTQDADADLTHLMLLPFGHVRREALIDRYVSLLPQQDAARAGSLRAEMREMLNTAFGHYYAPPVPIAVIALLQARAFNDQVNLTQSTYGYYYELLIKRSLALAGTLNEYDVSLGYLTVLAAKLYVDQIDVWDEEWFIEVHQTVNRMKGLDLRFKDVEGVLTDRGVIVRMADGRYKFRRDYFYYYFVARALAERLHEADGKAEVQALTTRLTDEKAANILLFLTHFSKDPAVIEPMIAEANRVFADAPRADLRPEHTTISDLEEMLRQAVYEERPIRESREQYLTALDERERSQGVVTDAPAATTADAQAREERSVEIREVTRVMDRIYEAFRTMQILGQLLKNFPGTLDAAQKHQITEAVYGVALRTLGFVQSLVRTHAEGLIHNVVDAIQRENADLSHQQLIDRARGTVAWYFYASAVGMIERAAQNVGTPLLAPIFDAVEKGDPVPAIQLISSAIALDRADRFPKSRVTELAAEFRKNPLATRVLRALVIAHFHLFEVDRVTKQQMCKLLDIAYQPILIVQAQGATRLLSPPTE